MLDMCLNYLQSRVRPQVIAAGLTAMLLAQFVQAQDAVEAGAAAEGTAATAAQNPAAAPTPGEIAPETPATALPTIADLTTQRETDSQNSEYDEATRTTLDQRYQEAIENLQAAEQAERTTAALAKELKQAPSKVTELEERLSAPPNTHSAEAIGETTNVEVLTAELNDAQGRAADARQHLQEITAEIERRNARRPQLPDLRAKNEQQLQQVEQDVAASAPPDEHPRVTAVRQLRLQTRQHRISRELSLLEQEARTYEGAARYRSVQRDMADRDAREAEREVKLRQQRLAEAQRDKARSEAELARRKLEESDESLRAEAERNFELADENKRLVNAILDSQLKLDDIDTQLKSRSDELESLQERAEKANFSPAIGVLLRNRQAAMPTAKDLLVEIETRQARIADLNLNLMTWEAERRPLLELSRATAVVINGLKSYPESISRTELEQGVQDLLAARLKLLSDLNKNGQDQLNELVKIQTQQKQLIDKLDEERLWIAEHVLWVRSTGIVGSYPRQFVAAASLLLDERDWRDAARLLLLDLSENSIWWLTGAVGVLAMAVVRRRGKRLIRELGEVAEHASCVDILPTTRTVLLSLLVAAPGPLLVFLIGARVSAIARIDGLLPALGSGLQFMAGCWAVIALVRQIAQSHGLADAHFGWPRPVLTALRRTTRFLSVALLPFVFVVDFTNELGDAEAIATVGRLAYLGSMACFAWSMYRLLRPASATSQALKSSDSTGLLYRSRRLWIALFLVLPIRLAVLSAIGFHYTAFQLTGRAALTLDSALIILLVTAFLHRWLLLTYRRLAIQRGRERRQQLLQAAQNDPDQTLPPEATPELTLVDINEQARSMLRLASAACSVIALYLIWVDVLPALGFLRNITFWDDSLAASLEDGTQPPITAADLLVGSLIGCLTILASRNLPGMMEISVLQRLPLDAGARYAATTVSRYLIVATGIVFGFRAIGIGWSSVQWLVAAMTVGLGFGLQEIFANFVSGIILLFERPMRVGDTVTIGGNSGTVTRIQTRATTILDWDRKELIVPNREFVTGNLINWTLTSPTLRIVIKVGIAYGSDTRQATDLLLRAANEHPLVLEDPAPFAVFTSFGPSSLDYDLRLYVSGLRNYGKVQHEMHIAIDDLFRQHKIEIAFPQRDLHVRSLPEDLIQQLSRTAAHPQAEEQNGHAVAATQLG